MHLPLRIASEARSLLLPLGRRKASRCLDGLRSLALFKRRALCLLFRPPIRRNMSSGMRWHARPSVSVLLLLRCGVLPWVAPEDECGEQDLGKLQQDHGLPRRVLIAATPCASHEFPADTVLGAHRCEARARKHGSSNIEALMLQFLRFCWSTSSVFCVCACVCRRRRRRRSSLLPERSLQSVRGLRPRRQTTGGFGCSSTQVRLRYSSL